MGCHAGVGWGGLCRVGWDIQGWGGSSRGGWVMQGWGGSWVGWVGHVGVGYSGVNGKIIDVTLT